MMKKKGAKESIDVNEIDMTELMFYIVGTSPLIMNRFSQKAWQQLLLPPTSVNRAEREQTLKHNPVEEFRGAVYRNRDDKRPSLIHVPNGMFHKAIASAALDIPGATKAKIERLTKIPDVNIDLYGVPRLFCAMVRNSDMNRTPDVRTRPIFDQWACKITVRYVTGILTERTIAALLGAAGKIVGIGDWRGEKGGPYGAFRLAQEDDKEFGLITKTMGRKAQVQALASPVCYDPDTEELLSWFEAEVARRERTSQLGAGAGRGRGTASTGRRKKGDTRQNGAVPAPKRKKNGDLAERVVTA